MYTHTYTHTHIEELVLDDNFIPKGFRLGNEASIVGSFNYVKSTSSCNEGLAQLKIHRLKADYIGVNACVWFWPQFSTATGKGWVDTPALPSKDSTSWKAHCSGGFVYLRPRKALSPGTAGTTNLLSFGVGSPKAQQPGKILLGL